MLAPSLLKGSQSKPPPHPMSNMSSFFNGSLSFRGSLKWEVSFSLMNLILAGLKMCNGLNLPFGFHHSLANFENLSISVLSTVLKMIIT